jgi:hypothetical protein
VCHLVTPASHLVSTVGGPLDASCKLEAMLEAIRIKEEELQHSLDEVHQLEQGLRSKLLEGRKNEQQQQQQQQASRRGGLGSGYPPHHHGVITAPKLIEEDMRSANDENDVSNDHAASASLVPPSLSLDRQQQQQQQQHPVTPPPHSKKIKNSFSSEEIPLADSASDLEEEEESDPVMELQVHRARLGSHITPEVQQHRIAMAAHTTAHSCASALACPSFNDVARSSHNNINNDYNYDGPATSGLPCYRVNDEDEFHGINLGFGCGTALFGERLLESHFANNNIAAGGGTGDAENSLMALSFDNSVLDEDEDPDGEDSIAVGVEPTLGDISRAAASVPALLAASRRSISPVRNNNNNNAAASGNSGPHSSPNSPTLRGGGSFDGINFRTGMSGHTGLNSISKKKKAPNGRPATALPRMSEHRAMGSAARYPHYE